MAKYEIEIKGPRPPEYDRIQVQKKPFDIETYEIVTAEELERWARQVGDDILEIQPKDVARLIASLLHAIQDVHGYRMVAGDEAAKADSTRLEQLATERKLRKLVEQLEAEDSCRWRSCAMPRIRRELDAILMSNPDADEAKE